MLEGKGGEGGRLTTFVYNDDVNIHTKEWCLMSKY